MIGNLMRRDIHYLPGIEVEEAVEIIRHCFFEDAEVETQEYTVNSVEEFQQRYLELLKYWRYERCLAELYGGSGNTIFKYYGRCEVCNSVQALVVDYQSAETRDGFRYPNWRERLVCPNCGCNNRQRFIAHAVFQNYQPGMKVLMHEQRTLIFQQLQKELPLLEGFEYMGENLVSGAYYDGVRYENPGGCTYENNEFDVVISNEVLAHVPDYKAAFLEAYRVLKRGGKFIFSMPFNANSTKTEIRAIVKGDATEHICEPWYRPNPVDGYPPLLVYQVFGWDILDELRKCGFSSVCGKVYYGIKDGYLGYLPLYFEAQK